MSDEHEFENTVSRHQAATSLRGVADGVDAGSLRFAPEGEEITVPVPETLELEIELEQEDDSIEVELELEWESPEVNDETLVEQHHAEIEDAAENESVDENADETSEGSTGQPVVGAAEPIESLARFEVFRDRADEWRWRLVHRNGNIIATSGESYTRKHNARKGVQSVMNNAPDADLVSEGELE